MSATTFKQIERLQRELEAAYDLIRVLTNSFDKQLEKTQAIEDRLTKLENGNRQRRTNRRD